MSENQKKIRSFKKKNSENSVSFSHHLSHDIAKRLHHHRIFETKSHQEVVRVGIRDRFWKDLYHHALTVSWPVFFSVSIAAYIAINTVFALLYALVPGQISAAGKHVFLSLFFFSVQTLSTVGYGSMSPVGIHANMIATCEVFIGMMLTALATGVVFARFSRPTARILFSDKAVIDTSGGVPVLSIRMANQRISDILLVEIELSLSRLIITETGHPIRCFDRLNLIQDEIPTLRFSFTTAHIIDEKSPLHHKTIDELSAEEAEIMITVTGTDEALGQTVSARMVYSFDRIHHHHRFVDILMERPDGLIAVDYTRLNDVERHQNKSRSDSHIPA